MTRLTRLALLLLPLMAQPRPAAAAEILLKSALNGRFVTLDASGYLAAAAVRPDDALILDFIVLPENRLALRVLRSNSFVRVAPGPGGLMTDGGAEIGRRERFDVLRLPENGLALRSLANGQFVHIEAGPQALLAAAGPEVGPAARFVIVQR